MSILEDLLAKVVEQGKDAGQKAKDTADVLALNAESGSSQSRMRELYREIGELVASDAFADYDKETLKKLLEEESALSERTITVQSWHRLYRLIMFLRSEEELVAMNTQKISRIRGEGVCPECGTPVSENTKFCPNCGTRIVRGEPEQETVQPQTVEVPVEASYSGDSDGEPEADETTGEETQE